MIKKLGYIATAFALPAVSFAAITNINQAGTTVINIINNTLVPVLFALAFIVFIWGAFNVFILGANNEEAKTNGKNLMIYGLIGFFVMISVWGLVNIALGTFQTNNTQHALPHAK